MMVSLHNVFNKVFFFSIRIIFNGVFALSKKLQIFKNDLRGLELLQPKVFLKWYKSKF